MYFLVKHTIIHYRSVSSEEKAELESRLLDKTSNWVSGVKGKGKISIPQPKLFIIRLFRQLAGLELETYATASFRIFFKKVFEYSTNYFNISLTSPNPMEINLTYRAINCYMESSKPVKNQLIYGEFKQAASTDPALEIYVAKLVEVNRTFFTHYFVKVKHTATGE